MLLILPLPGILDTPPGVNLCDTVKSLFFICRINSVSTILVPQRLMSLFCHYILYSYYCTIVNLFKNNR